MSERDEPAAAPLTPPALMDDPASPASPDPAPVRKPGARRAEGATDGGDGKPKRSLGRRITFWSGITMITVGLTLLAYVAWQLWGTNWLSKREQREITQQLQEDWAVNEGCDQFCPHGKASALIRIPKFGKDYVVPVLEGTSDDILAKGFGHFEDTAQAGQAGNYALAGHRITHGEPLRDMPDLRPGDKVIVETRKFTYTYVLDTNPNDLVIPFTGTWVLEPDPKNPDGGPEANHKFKRLITLTTCSELFHTDNRMIAFGHLVKAEKKTVRVPVG